MSYAPCLRIGSLLFMSIKNRMPSGFANVNCANRTLSGSAAKTLGAYVGEIDQVREALGPAVEAVLRQMEDMRNEVGATTIGDHPIRQTAIRAYQVNLLPKLIHLVQHHRLECTTGYMAEIDAATLRFMTTVLLPTEEEAGARLHQLRLPTVA
jgi:hypothetical protein